MEKMEVEGKRKSFIWTINWW